MSSNASEDKAVPINFDEMDEMVDELEPISLDEWAERESLDGGAALELLDDGMGSREKNEGQAEAKIKEKIEAEVEEEELVDALREPDEMFFEEQVESQDVSPAGMEDSELGELEVPLETGTPQGEAIETLEEVEAIGKIAEVTPEQDSFEDHGVHCDASGVILLEDGDRAEEIDAQRGILVLSREDLWENASAKGIVALSTADLACNQRRKLSDAFFERHDIQRDAQGVIELKPGDLRTPPVPARDRVEEPTRRKPRPMPVADTSEFDKKIFKVCLWIIIACLLGTILNTYFKYSWTITRPAEFEETKTKLWDSGSYMKWFDHHMRHRQNDSWFRWYGRRLLTPQSYTEAVNEKGAVLGWLFYEDSGVSSKGDDSWK